MHMPECPYVLMAISTPFDGYVRWVKDGPFGISVEVSEHADAMGHPIWRVVERIEDALEEERFIRELQARVAEYARKR
jgi:hypothetical protein